MLLVGNIHEIDEATEIIEPDVLYYFWGLFLKDVCVCVCFQMSCDYLEKLERSIPK